MMKKKVKKIPKYYNGELAVGMPDFSKEKINTRLGTTPPKKGGNSGVSAESGVGFNLPSGIATASNELLTNTFGIDDNSQAGVTLNAAAQGADIGGSIVPGWGHLIGGVAGGLMGALKKGSVDVNTGEITSGGIFGRSMHSLRVESNRIKNSIRSKSMTENLKADYANDPNVIINPNVLAAEGGIMRRPVDALVSKGELIYNPMTKKLSKVPGSKGNPNKADDVYARLSEGDVVISNSPTMLMANGKTPALNLEGLIDSDKNVKVKEAIIKKVVNWLEANKTKPQEYAKFNEGYPGFFSYLISNRTRPIDAVISEYMKRYGKMTDEFKGFNGSDESFLLGLLKIITTNDKYILPIRFKDGRNFDQIRSMPISSAVEFNPEYWNYYNQSSISSNAAKANVDKPVKPLWEPTENKNKTTHPEINNVWSRHKRGDFVEEETSMSTVPAASEKKLETAVSKKGTVNKPSSGKKTTISTQQETKPLQINQDVLDWAKQEASRAMSQYAPNTTKVVAPGLVSPKIDPTEMVEESALPGASISGRNRNTGSIEYTGSNWRDGLYRMAVLSQPLWDRAKAEPVNYESPIYKYMPTAVDVSSQLRDVDQSYALARYNFANLYPNTGAGMAAGLQAASNRAKQLADIRQYQTNAQNELIGKNVGIYNNWANEHARIMNDVYNKTAANRATAKNINRQNRAAALSNYGQMLRDDRQYSMDTLKMNMLEPLLSYGTENSDTLIKKARQIING